MCQKSRYDSRLLDVYGQNERNLFSNTVAAEDRQVGGDKIYNQFQKKLIMLNSNTPILALSHLTTSRSH